MKCTSKSKEFVLRFLICGNIDAGILLIFTLLKLQLRLLHNLLVSLVVHILFSDYAQSMSSWQIQKNIRRTRIFGKISSLLM